MRNHSTRSSIALFIAIIALVVAIVGLCSYQTDCGGVFRWSVKVVSDTGKINLKAIPITISELIKNKPGRKIKTNTPRFGIEHNTYTIKCRIREWKRESDGDLHLVLVDLEDSTKTMVGELANPLCSSVQKSRFIQSIQTAREYFDANVKSKNGKAKEGIYQIKGIAYFDFFHQQLGANENGIELHPILKITKL